jgi:hypothetical protein
MRIWAVAGLMVGMAGPVLAAPMDGIYRNASGAVLVVQGATDDQFGFVLSAGVADGETTCAEGAVDCLLIAGTALLDDASFVYDDPDDPGSHLVFDEGAVLTLTTVSGDLGSGSGNRFQLAALAGDYALTDEMGVDPADAAMAEELVTFRSPTGNIACLAVVSDLAEVRCDLVALERVFTAPPPDCELDWGDSFAVQDGGGPGVLVCHGDTVIDPGAMVLDYGQSLQFGGITCRSEKTGMTCDTAEGHGFSVSKRAQKLF